jgi:hypothetical protein
MTWDALHSMSEDVYVQGGWERGLCCDLEVRLVDSFVRIRSDNLLTLNASAPRLNFSAPPGCYPRTEELFGADCGE